MKNDTQRFFISCALGFEKEVELEIREVWGGLLNLDGRPHSFELSSIDVIKGGVEIQVPLHLGLQLNFFLKIPHRILLRLKEFRCRDFPKLFSEVQKIDFSNYLDPKTLTLEVAASKSRLNNEKRISQTMEEALKITNPDPGNKLFVRFFDDLVTISLDTSGEHLHFRTGQFKKGEAPLRETLATYAIRQMIRDLSAAELSQIQWLDPMMGSGTFLLELASWGQANSRREYSFQNWKAAPKIFKSKDWFQNYPSPSPIYQSLLGRDRDSLSVETARDNFSVLKQGATLETRDLFIGPARKDRNRLWVVTNPPYGERIESDFTPQALLEQIALQVRPEKIGILFSRKQSSQLQHIYKLGGIVLKRLETYDVLNGGIQCQFQIWICDCESSPC